MNKIVNILKIANKARCLVVGEELVLKGIRNKSVLVCILASDAGINTTKRISDKSKFYNVPLINDLSGDDLEYILGKPGRKVLGVVDKGFAESILEK